MDENKAMPGAGGRYRVKFFGPDVTTGTLVVHSGMAGVPGVKSEVIRIDLLVNGAELGSQAMGPVGSKLWRLDYFQTAGKLGIKWKGERSAVLTLPVRSFFDHQPHT